MYVEENNIIPTSKTFHAWEFSSWNDFLYTEIPEKYL